MAKTGRGVRKVNPYKNFQFRVKWDGRYVAGISKLSGLKRTIEVLEFRDAADPGTTQKVPGRTKYEPITLERGITHDTEFEQWANSVASGAAPAKFRKDIIIDLFNEAGKKVLSYKVFRCWVSEYQVMSDFDANTNAVAIERLKLENEGWERDTG
jgi:phage tail-like protein